LTLERGVGDVRARGGSRVLARDLSERVRLVPGGAERFLRVVEDVVEQRVTLRRRPGGRKRRRIVRRIRRRRGIFRRPPSEIIFGIIRRL